MLSPYRLPDEFETDRYVLRRPRPRDAEAIFQGYATDGEVTRYLGWAPHRHVGETEAFLASIAREWEDGTGFPLVVAPREARDTLIGMFHPHLRRSTVNYGYVLRADRWGQGCATEILRWLVGHALSHPAIHRTEAFCDVANAASARVMEKAGMSREGVLRRYFLHPNISDVPRDCAMYSRVR